MSMTYLKKCQGMLESVFGTNYARHFGTTGELR